MINFLKKITASQGLILVGCICAAVVLSGCDNDSSDASVEIVSPAQQQSSNNNQGDDSESETQENEGEGQDSSDTEGAPKTTFADINAVQNLEKAKEAMDNAKEAFNEAKKNAASKVIEYLSAFVNNPDSDETARKKEELDRAKNSERISNDEYIKAKEAYDLIYNSEDVPGGEQAESIIGDEQAESIIGDEQAESISGNEQQVAPPPPGSIFIGDDWFAIDWKPGVTADDIANTDPDSIGSYVDTVTDRGGKVVDLSPPDGGTNPVAEAILGSNQAAQIDSGTRCIDSAGDPLKCENLL